MSSDPLMPQAGGLQGMSAEQKRALLERMLAQKAVAQQAADHGYPLSFAQQRLWFIDQLEAAQTAYTIPAALRLDGPLDVDLLRHCLTGIVERHEILRTRFVAEDGAEPQQLVDPARPVPMPLVEPKQSQDDEAQAVAAELRALCDESFDLALGPLLRARLLCLGDDRHVLLLTVHHIIADYWSLRVLMREIALLYRAAGDDDAMTLPGLPIQYLDYAVWQRDRQQQLDAELDYWRTQLADMPTLLQLPTDFPRPAHQRFHGARHAFTLPAEVAAPLRALARTQKTTLFAVLLAGLESVLFRYSGQGDFAIGTTATNRNRDELRDLIGLFVNNLVLRARLANDMPFNELLQQAHQTNLAALAHQEVPFERVVEAIDPQRQLSHNALFQVMFVLHNTPIETLQLPELTISALDIDHRSARFDLSLDMVDSGDALHGFFEYSSDLFQAASIERLVRHFTVLLSAVGADPQQAIGAITLIDDSDRACYAALNATQADMPDDSVHRRIERQAKRTPGHTAAMFGDQQVDYDTLNARANQLARHLARRGAGPGDAIALCLPRSLELLIGLLAVLKLGGHYVPLDPQHPPARLQHALLDAGARLLLSHGGPPASVHGPESPWINVDIAYEQAAIAEQAVHDLDDDGDGERLCYLIYTSGSTGKPKGVPIRHRNLVNLLSAMAAAPGIAAEDRLLAVTTIAFDIATLELLLPLWVGACVVIADDTTTSDGRALADQIEADGITVMQATPAGWRLLLEAGWAPPPGFVSLCGGEALEPALARRLLDQGCDLWNLYGPTETTIWSGALHQNHAMIAGGAVPIGAPIANTGLHVLETGGQLAPVGVAGELCISGAGLSAGYHGRDDLTAERFITPRDGALDGIRLYRTGDRVNLRADGTLVFRGRLDHQVKLRGFRIELGEIESVLNDHPAISSTLVMLDDTGHDRLIAYCETASSPDVDESALRHFLADRLPAYMIPAAFVLLARMPLSPNGKIDRKALPAPRVDTREAQPLRTATERQLADIWAKLLAVPVADANANFFAIGGHSLLAARMASRVRAEMGIELPVRRIFEQAQLADLASWIEQQGHDNGTTATIMPRPADAPAVLSHAQHRQWVLAGLEPDNPFYNIPAAVRFDDRIDAALLERALGDVVARHDVLQTAYRPTDGEPRPTLCGPRTPELTRHLLDIDAAVEREQALRELLRDAARQPFDLSQPPLLRALHVDCGDHGHVVMLVLHHIAGDAWSMQTLFDELIRLYLASACGEAMRLPLLKLGYLDYAHWESQRDNSASLAYWRQQLAGVPPLLDLPTDFPRPAQQAYVAGEVRFTVDADCRRALDRLGSRHGATLFMVLLAAFDALLHRFSAVDDIVVGCPTGHRPHPDLDGVVGLFVNTLAMRARPTADMPFAELLDAVRETVLAGFAHLDAPFEQIVNELDLPRSWGHAPLFQVMFLWQQDSHQAMPAATHERSWAPLTLPVTTTKVDLTLAMSGDADGGLHGRLEYREDLFHRATIESLADAFAVMLRAVADAPATAIGALPLLSEARAEALATWNDTHVAFPPGGLLHTRFEQLAARSPEATALIASDATLSYAELNALAERVAATLADLGIGTEDRVGVCLQRHSALIVAILGVLKAGGTYVPLDPDYPRERIEFIVDDAQLRVVLTEQSLRDTIRTGQAQLLCVEQPQDDTLPAASCAATPANAAYIIYTSGSTGRPKGVTIEHRSPVTLVNWAESEYEPARLAGVLVSTSVCFDLSVFEIFVPLSTGGCLILADNALALPTLAAADRVTLINTVPTAAAELVRRNAIPASVTTVNIAGEPLSSALVRALYETAAIDRVYNLYGPSEDTTYSTGALLRADEPGAFSPIGRPLANTRAYVLDSRMRQVAPGFPGELYLAGDGVARGYWDRPALTAERFIPDPFGDDEPAPSERLLYMTGDRVRLRHDGELAFLGRLDNQIKLRGFRIELGEIEAALEQHADVQQSALRVWQPATRGDEAAAPRLLAYLVLTADAAAVHASGTLPPASGLAETLRQFVGERLPQYMVPAQFVVLDAMPLLPNGKVARNALPEPTLGDADDSDEAPLSDAEAQMAGLWRDLLQRDTIGPRDNFFALGGDSILALQLVARARQQGLSLTPRDVFQYPTVTGLSAVLAERGSAVPVHEAVTGKVALTPAQHWFFALPLQHRAHWNQAVLLDVRQPLDHAHLRDALLLLAERHDALRSTFNRDGATWHRSIAEHTTELPLRIIASSDPDIAARIAQTAADVQRGFDLENGPLWCVAYFESKAAEKTERRLLFVCHHLLVDGVSWRILLGDLQEALLQFSHGGQAALAPASTPLSHWVDYLRDQYRADADETTLWRQLDAQATPSLPRDHVDGSNLMRDADTITRNIDAATTGRLLQELHDAHQVALDELLLAALARALAPWHGQPCLRVELEGHGRPDLDTAIDLSRTVGWLTTLYPLDITIDAQDADQTIRLVRSTLRQPSHRGLGYGVARYLGRGEDDRTPPPATAELRFNYLGQADQLFPEHAWFAPASEPIGTLRHPHDDRGLVFDINAIVSGGQLKLHWGYSRGLHERDTVERLATAWIEQIRLLLDHCLGTAHDGGYIAEDFPQMDFAPGELDQLLKQLD